MENLIDILLNFEKYLWFFIYIITVIYIIRIFITTVKRFKLKKILMKLNN